MFWKWFEKTHHKRIYLDYAAGAEGNPSSPHEEGRAAKAMLEAARTDIARLTEVKPDDIIFTSGATEANNLAIQGLATPGAHFLYLPSAHASVVETMHRHGGEPLVIKNGRIDIEALTTQIKPETVLVSVDAVCGETGTIWNTREVANALQHFAATPSARSAQAARPMLHLAKGMAAPLLHVDASQAPLTEKISRAHFSADLLTLDSQKVGGPRGIGCLIAHRTIPLTPILFGGGQERGLRPGTQSPELARDFAAALRAAAGNREDFASRARSAREFLIDFITKQVPNVYINEGREVVPHILNLSLPGRDTDYLVALLDEAGYAVSTRSACETNSETGSRAVLALTGNTDRAKSTLRISWGRDVSERSLMHFARALREAVAFLDNARTKSHY